MVARKAGLRVHGHRRSSAEQDGGGDLGKAPAVIEAAFSQDVLDGRLSSIVEVEKGRGVVLHATDHVLPQQKPLEAVRAEVVAAWKKQRGAEVAARAAAEAVKRLTAGEPWDSVAKSLGATPEGAEVRRPIGSGGAARRSQGRIRWAEARGRSPCIPA